MIEVFQPPCNHQLVSHLPGCNVLGIQSSVIKIKKSLSQCSFAQAVTVKHWFLTTWATNLLLWFLTTWTTNLLLWFLTTWTINSLLWKQIKCCSSPTDRACDTSLPGVPFKEACVVAEGNIALSQSCGNSLNVRLQRSQVTKVSGYKGLGLQRSQATKVSAAQLSHQSSGAVWKSRWPSWAFHPHEPYRFCGHKATLNHASASVAICP